VSDLLCTSKLVHASPTKEHDNNDNIKRTTGELLSGVERPEDLLGDKGLMKELKLRLMDRMPVLN